LTLKNTETTPIETINYTELNEVIALNIEQFLEFYNIEYTTYPNRIAFPCPIHKSDRKESLTVFTSGSTSVGNFVCWTNHCENEIGRGVVNLIKYLVKEKYGNSSMRKVLEQVELITGNKCPTELSLNKDIRNFNNLVSKINTNIETKILATREYVKQNLTIPAEYYINRGFSSKTLEHFDVGTCVKRGQEMFMRVVVPVYDKTGQFLIGCVGRSINPECVLCGRYHLKNRACPSNNIEERWSRKWINSSNFSTGNYLYNLWNAFNPAREKQKLILVEGQGDVWKLHEAEIPNAVGLFGNQLTDNQFSIIESLGVTDIYIALDMDEEGLKARTRIIDKLQMYYNIHEIELTHKDVGDMPISDIKSIFKEAI